MCDIALAAAATSIAATGAGYAGQYQAAQAQGEYGASMYAANARAARLNYQNQLSSLDTRMDQERAAAVQAGEGNFVAAQQAKGAAAASAAERGVQGNSVDALLSDFDRQEAWNAESIKTNYRWTAQQAQEEKKSARANAQRAISSGTPPPVQMPPLLGAALSIGSQAFGAYDAYSFRSQTGHYDRGQRTVGGTGSIWKIT